MRKIHPLMRVGQHYSPAELIIAAAAMIAFLVMGGGMVLFDWMGV